MNGPQQEFTKPVAGKTTRTIIAYLVMVFCFASIGFLVGFGNEENSLHVSALSWAYTILAFVLASVFGDAAISKWLDLRKT